jgi:hypothetical protein
MENSTSIEELSTSSENLPLSIEVICSDSQQRLDDFNSLEKFLLGYFQKSTLQEPFDDDGSSVVVLNMTNLSEKDLKQLESLLKIKRSLMKFLLEADEENNIISSDIAILCFPMFEETERILLVDRFLVLFGGVSLPRLIVTDSRKKLNRFELLISFLEYAVKSYRNGVDSLVEESELCHHLIFEVEFSEAEDLLTKVYILRKRCIDVKHSLLQLDGLMDSFLLSHAEFGVAVAQPTMAKVSSSSSYERDNNISKFFNKLGSIHKETLLSLKKNVQSFMDRVQLAMELLVQTQNISISQATCKIYERTNIMENYANSVDAIVAFVAPFQLFSVMTASNIPMPFYTSPENSYIPWALLIVFCTLLGLLCSAFGFFGINIMTYIRLKQ